MLMQLVPLGELCSNNPIPQRPPQSSPTLGTHSSDSVTSTPSRWNQSGSVGAVAWLIGYFSGGVWEYSTCCSLVSRLLVGRLLKELAASHLDPNVQGA